MDNTETSFYEKNQCNSTSLSLSSMDEKPLCAFPIDPFRGLLILATCSTMLTLSDASLALPDNTKVSDIHCFEFESNIKSNFLSQVAEQKRTISINEARMKVIRQYEDAEKRRNVIIEEEASNSISLEYED